MKFWKKLLIFLGGLIVFLFASSLVWSVSQTREAEQGALAFLESDSQVDVIEEEWITFSPLDQQPSVGFIFLPGGNVSHLAYLPPLQRIAAQGFLVVDVPMPLNLAVLGYKQAAQVIAAHPEITHWVIGGHSLGGAMAARFAAENPGSVEGVVFWAAYPSDSNDLSQMDMAVLSLYGTQDGVARPDKIERTRPLLPVDAQMIEIEGGNHAQFGFYGEQNGDNLAAISREAQQDVVVEATGAFLAQFGE